MKRKPIQSLISKTCGLFMALSVLLNACSSPTTKTETQPTELTAMEILGNPKYQAISFGGYRTTSRDTQPTIDELKEDLRILDAMGVKLLRTYNVYYAEAGNLLQAITDLKKENPDFEMYVMLGAWIDCKNARTEQRIHSEESEANAGEIDRAVQLANKFPDIVKIIAVGNEAMVKWAESYYVEPQIILKWVKHLQQLKADGKLNKNCWITTSDNFASWGGGGAEYHVPALNELIKTVDFISMHTYPMHDTHYNPEFWGVPAEEEQLPDAEKIASALNRSLQYAQNQYASVVAYMKSLGVDKPVHIGETGWSSFSNEFYGPEGSKAVDEYKSGEYYKLMREWTNREKITCFYFEAFDEPWKDAANPDGSENHFGLIDIDGKAKYAIWDLVDKGVFNGLTRGGNAIEKSLNGNLDSLMKDVLVPPTAKAISEAKKKS